ncbi:hypothetical protein HA466_0231120 [Hirschfeldia incana]|nr:hypothetical protein HA466_0231120 [Hirschfeldia incana]
MNSFVLFLCFVFIFVTILMSRASVDVSFDNCCAVGSTQSECGLTGFRLSTAVAPPLPRPPAVSPSSRFTVATPSTHSTAATPTRLPVALSICRTASPQPVDHHSFVNAVTSTATRAISRRPDSFSRSTLVHTCMGFQNWASTPGPILIDVNLKELNQSPHIPCALSLNSDPVSPKLPSQPHTKIIEFRTVIMRLHIVLDLTSVVFLD